MNALEMAKSYFQLSNEARLERIETLFHPHATYSSATYGLYYGPEAILAMMRPFFASYERRRWTVVSAEAWSENIAEVVFSFEGVTTGGEQILREGVERLVVHNDKIQHIEVRPKV